MRINDSKYLKYQGDRVYMPYRLRIAGLKPNSRQVYLVNRYDALGRPCKLAKRKVRVR